MARSSPGRGWRPPRWWRVSMLLARGLVALVARLRVSGDLPRRDGPMILAANHLSPFDPIALTAACHTRRVAPRFLATGGLFRAPVVGAVMRRWGHIPVHRGTTEVTRALPAAAAALAEGAVLLVYPEGRITLDPELWPERGRTGVARLALATGAPVVPVAQWGAHEVVPYRAPRGLLRALPVTLWRRPRVQVRFGSPVDLSDLSSAVPGHAQRATDRIMDAITATLAPLRVAAPGRPRHVDPSRPSDPRRRRPRPAPTDGPPAAGGQPAAGGESRSRR